MLIRYKSEKVLALRFKSIQFQNFLLSFNNIDMEEISTFKREILGFGWRLLRHDPITIDTYSIHIASRNISLYFLTSLDILRYPNV
jgi:hypothetical protein